MNYLGTLIPSVIEASVAAGLAFFGAWAGSDAKVAAIAAGGAFFGALSVHHVAESVTTAKADAPAPPAAGV